MAYDPAADSIECKNGWHLMPPAHGATERYDTHRDGTAAHGRRVSPACPCEKSDLTLREK